MDHMVKCAPHYSGYSLACTVGYSYMLQHTLTSFFCLHSHFFTKVSHSILVCCSYRHNVGRVGHQTKDVMGQVHPSRKSDCFEEGLTHKIERLYSSILHLISSQTDVMG